MNYFLRLFIIAAAFASCTQTPRDESGAGMFARQFSTSLSSHNRFDSVFIAALSVSDTLSYQVLRGISGLPVDNELADDLTYLINSVAEIDSLKQSGGYHAYRERLGIGMTEEARAFPIGALSLGNNNLLVWGIEIRSYEACPYFTGTFVIGSYADGAAYIHVPLAKQYGAGDPPSFMEETASSGISSNVITVNGRVVSDDDSEQSGQAIESYTLQVDFNARPKIIGSRMVESDDRPSQ